MKHLLLIPLIVVAPSSITMERLNLATRPPRTVYGPGYTPQQKPRAVQGIIKYNANLQARAIHFYDAHNIFICACSWESDSPYLSEEYRRKYEQIVDLSNFHPYITEEKSLLRTLYEVWFG